MLFKLANFNFTQLSNLVLWLLRMHLTFQRLTCHVQPPRLLNNDTESENLFFSFFSSFSCVKNYFLNDLNKKHLSLSEENIENITISLHNILWCGQEFWVMIFNQKILFLPCTKIEYYSGFSIINDYFFIAGFILWTNHLRVNCIKKLQLQLVFTTI